MSSCEEIELGITSEDKKRIKKWAKQIQERRENQSEPDAEAEEKKPPVDEDLVAEVRSHLAYLRNVENAEYIYPIGLAAREEGLTIREAREALCILSTRGEVKLHRPASNPGCRIYYIPKFIEVAEVGDGGEP